jgi:uncharacterized Fe-S center protein
MADTGAAKVYHTPMRSPMKKSLVARVGSMMVRAGIEQAVEENDLVAVKLHFGEPGNTGFVRPIFLREVVERIRAAGGKPFLTDANTLYRGKRANAADHLTSAIQNGFDFSVVDAPLVIADGLDGREACDVTIEGFTHFDSVRIGSAAVHADALVAVTHFKGHEATGFGGALKNVGMGLGCRSAKQRMHSDLKPQIAAEKCTACARCVKNCPVDAIAIGPDRVAVIDYDVCYGCGECVAQCPYGAIAVQWKTEPRDIQEKIVEHVAGAVAGKEGKVLYVNFVTDVSPDCDCWSFSDASLVPDLGALCSTDPVALDQACLDLVGSVPGLAGSRAEGMEPGVDKFKEITGIDGTLGLAYAESHGLGTRRYELVTVQ